jgi:hypothetical protein
MKALAVKAGVAVGTIASIEGGGNTKPHPRTRKRIAGARSTPRAGPPATVATLGARV